MYQNISGVNWLQELVSDIFTKYLKEDKRHKKMIYVVVTIYQKVKSIHILTKVMKILLSWCTLVYIPD